MTDRQVHPVAALFRMLTADELKALAADISERGQLQPIVLDAEGRVLDGRNRLAACELAEVEPVFTTYEGDDPDGYALAVNSQRRDLTQGKRALIAVRLSSKLELNGNRRPGDQRDLARDLRVPKSRVAEAALVDRWAPALGDAVLRGSETLSVAVEKAREEKRKDEENQAKLDRLSNEDPKLRARVDDGRITVDE